MKGGGGHKVLPLAKDLFKNDIIQGRETPWFLVSFVLCLREKKNKNLDQQKVSRIWKKLEDRKEDEKIYMKFSKNKRKTRKKKE